MRTYLKPYLFNESVFNKANTVVAFNFLTPESVKVSEKRIVMLLLLHDYLVLVVARL